MKSSPLNIGHHYNAYVQLPLSFLHIYLSLIFHFATTTKEMGRLPIKIILGYTSWDYEGINVRVQKDTATTKGSKNIINIGNIL